MLLAVLGGYLLALICAFFYRWSPKLLGYFSSFAVALMASYFFSYWGDISGTEGRSFTYSWVPSLNLNLTFYLDGLSLFFALLITVFGALILLYSTGYMKGQDHSNRFFAYMLVFMASMLGLVLSGNLIQLYIFWELTSISSFLLIGYEHAEPEARTSALQALLVTAGGGLALLAGLILIGVASDSFTLSEVLNANIQESPYATGILVLVLLGAFTKSAQFPFHFWLPNAMAAPTPVSAYLHSATMVKAGIFLLLRFQPVMVGIEGWSLSLLIVGGITTVFAAGLSLLQFDLKKILAYITVSALGLMVVAIGIGTEEALKAGLVYLLVHALYKGCLFLVAGNIDHETGTKDIRQLGQLLKKMPWTAAAAIMASLSMAGLPPALGFIGKEKVYEASLHAPELAILLTGALFASSALYVAIALIIAYGLFFTPPEASSPRAPHPVPWPMAVPPLIMAGTGLFTGVFNQELSHTLLSPAISPVIGKNTEIELTLWHGFNWVLLLSALTYLVGFFVYIARHRLHAQFQFVHQNLKLSPEGVYFRTISALRGSSVLISRWVQNGYLRSYVFIIFTFLVLLVGGVYLNADLVPGEISVDHPVLVDRLYELIPLFLIVIGLMLIFYSRSRLTILIATSLLGFGVASVFVFFSAPDVSMTQFLVETITVVLFMLILHRLPRHQMIKSKKRRFAQIVLSLLFGGLMTLILLNINEVRPASALKEYYLRQSKPAAQGENVVNVILVDFRALDTLGEITVLGITALGIVALFSLNLRKEEK